MSKTLVIGDIHGRTIWKDIVKENEWEHCVILGDYFDPYEDYSVDNMLENFKEIIEFKEQNPDKVHLIFGNHDYHYLHPTDRYSRYDHWGKDAFEKVLREQLDKGNLQFAYQDGNVLFTHAGVTNTWSDMHGVDYSDISTVAEQVNKAPFNSFEFAGWDCYGDSMESSPTWVRLRALGQDKIEGLVHVVGHTQVYHISHNDDNTVWCVDALGTSREYLIIEGENFKVKKYEVD